MDDAILSLLRKDGIKRLGILGGTFNPVHNGHIRLCKAAVREYDLDRCLLLVCGNPPHKGNVEDKQHRFEMVKLAVGDEQALCVSSLEIDRPGITYTIDSLRQIHAQLGDVELFYIIGADTLYEISSWSQSQSVLEMTNFICFSRPGVDDRDYRAYVCETFSGYANKICFAKERGMDISATDVRRRIAQRLRVDALLNSNVIAYIKQNGLYLNCAMTYEQAQQKLEKTLTKSRFAHTLGVVETAQRLARRYGVDESQTRWAALLHDCAKHLSFEQALALCAEYGLNNGDLGSRRYIIHSVLGVQIAQREYDMHDSGVLSAIACHTTGKTDMSALDKIIYLADIIEPTRTFDKVEELRRVALEDLSKSVRLAMDYSIQYVIEQGEVLDVQTVCARNQLLIESKIDKGDTL